MNRYYNQAIHDMHDMAVELDESEMDFTVPARDVLLGYDDNGVTVSWPQAGQSRTSLAEEMFGRLGQNTGRRMSEMAVKSLAGLVGVPESYVWGSCSPSLQQHNLSEQLAKRVAHASRTKSRSSGQLKFRTADHGDTVRVVASGDYTLIHNSAITRIIADTLGDDPRVSLVRPYLGRDNMYVKVLVQGDGDSSSDGRYGFGFAVRNDEVRGGAIEICGLIQRHSCTNSAVVGERWTYRHSHSSPELMLAQVANSIASALRFSEQMVDRVALASRVQVPNLSKVLDDLLKRNNYNEEIRREAQRGAEPSLGQTMEGLIAGITWAAHRAGDPAVEESLEMLAGRVLTGDELANNLFVGRWERVR